MKTILLSLTAIFVFLNYEIAEAKEVTVHVQGMVCGFCAQGIEKKFKAFSEVKKVEVSLEEKQVRLILNDGRELSDEKIEAQVKSAGYNVEFIERSK